MITIKNTQRSYPIDTIALQKKIATVLTDIGYPDYDLTIWFTTNETIRNYNKRFRNKNKATDVISFPYYEAKKPGILPKKSAKEPIIGDILLSPAYIERDLPKWPSQTFNERIIILIVHSICHLLGYDHETDAEYANMHAEEQRLLKLVEKK